MGMADSCGGRRIGRRIGFAVNLWLTIATDLTESCGETGADLAPFMAERWRIWPVIIGNKTVFRGLVRNRKLRRPKVWNQ
jgi:hypothetical protein